MFRRLVQSTDPSLRAARLEVFVFSAWLTSWWRTAGRMQGRYRAGASHSAYGRVPGQVLAVRRNADRDASISTHSAVNDAQGLGLGVNVACQRSVASRGSGLGDSAASMKTNLVARDERPGHTAPRWRNVEFHFDTWHGWHPSREFDATSACERGFRCQAVCVCCQMGDCAVCTATAEHRAVRFARAYARDAWGLLLTSLVSLSQWARSAARSAPSVRRSRSLVLLSQLHVYSRNRVVCGSFCCLARESLVK